MEQGFQIGMMVPFCTYAWTVIAGKSKPYFWLSSVFKKQQNLATDVPHPHMHDLIEGSFFGENLSLFC